MKRIVALISGNGSNLEAIMQSCDLGNINGRVEAVISNNPDAYGIERANKFNINTKIINHKNFENRIEFDDELENVLTALEPDLIILAGFMRILGKKIINKFANKMINLHPSLLPLYPGLNTHEQVLKNNDKRHGISIHFVTPKLDAGPLIAQASLKIKNNEDLDQVINRIHKIEHYLLPKVVAEICLDNIHLDSNNIVRYADENFKPRFFFEIDE
tara:strand:- start:52650 stop:53297 length:648 start_codon:yes stop_codon:yes gene_type:complete